MAKILVVDDSRIARAIARNALISDGHTVTEADSTNTALDILDAVLAEQGPRVDAIVLDWNMPGGNGLEFLHVLRGRTDTASTPVLFATSEADPRRMSYAQQAGADAYLLKPYTAQQIINATRSVIRQHP